MNGYEIMKKKLIDWFMLFSGTLLLSAGVYFFKIPNGFSTGGVSGISTVLSPFIPVLSPATLIMIINMILLLVGFFVLGKSFGIRTAVCSICFSAFTWIFEKIIPLKAPLTDQPFLELTYAMLLTSIGSAILFSRSASSGGTDIVALILKKYTAVDTGKALLISDSVIACSSFFVFGIKIGLFSVLGLFVKAFLVDNVIESLNLCKYFTIVTENPQPICNYIINELHHSVTQIDSIGAYTNREKKVLLVVCKRIEGVRLKKQVNEIDSDAFFMITNTSEIIGRGFRQV